MSRETVIALTLTMDQHAMLLRTPSPIMPGEGVSSWNLQWDISPDGRVTSPHWVRGNYSLSIGMLLSYCKPEVLKHTLPGMEHAPLKSGECGGPGLAYLLPVHLLMPDSVVSPGQYVWYICTTWSSSYSCQPPSSEGQQACCFPLE